MDSLRIDLIHMRSEKDAISQNLDSIADYLVDAKARVINNGSLNHHSKESLQLLLGGSSQCAIQNCRWTRY